MRQLRRLVVDGDSMLPALRPGDRVLVVPSRPRPGQVVALRDPRGGPRVVVKRVAWLTEDGVWVMGDNPLASTDSRHFGAVAHRLVLGRVLYRYAPPDRAGRV